MARHVISNQQLSRVRDQLARQRLATSPPEEIDAQEERDMAAYRNELEMKNLIRSSIPLPPHYGRPRA